MKRPPLLNACLTLFVARSLQAAVPVSVPGNIQVNFDSLPAAPQLSEFNWTDNVTVPGVYLHRSNSPAAPQTNLAGTLNTAGARPYVTDGSAASNGSPNIHGFLSLGIAGSADRALGASPTTSDGTGNWAGGELNIVVIVTNTSPADLYLATISYDIEAYRTNSLPGTQETVSLRVKTGTEASLLADLGTRTVSSTFSQAGWPAVLNTAGQSFDYTSGFNSVPSTFTRTGDLQTRLRVAAGQSVAFAFGNRNDTDTDAQIGIDNLQLRFEPPMSAVVSAVTRSNSGTPFVPGDDSVSFDLRVTSAAGSPSGWETDAPLSESGSYGTIKHITNVPLSSFPEPGHTLSMVVRDRVNTTSTATATVTAPWCTISPLFNSIVYSENGTPDNADDDSLQFMAGATGQFTGPEYTVSGFINGQTTYGTQFPASGIPGGAINLTFSDTADPACTSALSILLPATIGENQLPGDADHRLLSAPMPSTVLWTLSNANRTLLQTGNPAQVDHTVLSEVINLSSTGAVNVFASFKASAKPLVGFQQEDSFSMEAIVDGIPQNLLINYDQDMDGELRGGATSSGELPGLGATTAVQNYEIYGRIPASANSLQLRITGNSNSPDEKFEVSSVRIVLVPPSLDYEVLSSSLDNMGTETPDDDVLTASVNLFTVNVPGTGWNSNLAAPFGPASGLYSQANPITFTLPGTLPRCTIADNVNAGINTEIGVQITSGSNIGNYTWQRNLNGPGDEDDTLTGQVDFSIQNAGPSFNVIPMTAVIPGPATVSGGPFPLNQRVNITLQNLPNSASDTELYFGDSSYGKGGVIRIAIPEPPSPGPRVIGRRDFGTGITSITGPAQPNWINYPGSRQLVMRENAGAGLNSVVESESINITNVQGVLFTALLQATKTGLFDFTATNFKTTDKLKAELVIDGVVRSLISSYDKGDGRPSSSGANGSPDGYINGYLGSSEADYNANRGRDEFNLQGQPVYSDIAATMPLSYFIPAGARSVKLRLTGRGVSSSGISDAKAFILSNVLFFHSPVDFDADGIPNDFETSFGLDPMNPADKLLDPDRDGQNNWQEYLARTNPFDPNSRLRVLSIQIDPATAECQLTWTSVPGLRYRIQGSPALAGANWSDLSLDSIQAADAAATTTATSTLPSPLGPHYFLRVVALP